MNLFDLKLLRLVGRYGLVYGAWLWWALRQFGSGASLYVAALDSPVETREFVRIQAHESNIFSRNKVSEITPASWSGRRFRVGFLNRDKEVRRRIVAAVLKERKWKQSD